VINRSRAGAKEKSNAERKDLEGNERISQRGKNSKGTQKRSFRRKPNSAGALAYEREFKDTQVSMCSAGKGGANEEEG